PDIARTLGKTMAQFKNATEDIKSEIHKGIKENGLDESLTKITGNIQAEIGRAKENLLGDAPKQLNDIKENIIGDTNEQVARTQAEIDDITGPIKRQI
ncbi:MAG TPA: twin-arginine translocase TatA/TatE family subunit, partial [Flavobacterium sp.]|nr:twin-arginine translocase TatA/TatE family subunit [Flavobacterium sp.]